MLLNTLNALVDSLTGLERILTTPIPYSFSVHLWTVTLLYCAALPFQLLKTMGWVTIPGTALVAFIFTGFVGLILQWLATKDSVRAQQGVQLLVGAAQRFLL